MAKKDKEIDQLFRNQLQDYTVAPSRIAWEKLDKKLALKKANKVPFWIGIAASFVLLFGLAYYLMVRVQPEKEVKQTITGIQEEVQDPVIEDPAILAEEEVRNEESIDSRKQTEPSQKPIVPIHKDSNIKPNQNIVPEKTEEIPSDQNLALERTETEPIEIAPVELPELALDDLVAEIDLPEKEEVAYKVRIVSRGFAIAPEKETLVDEIENKIDKIGGLLNKVDQGFADLQDAKNNLFIALTTKKEKK